MRLLVVEDSPLLRKMFGLAFPQQLNDLQPQALRAVVQNVIDSPRG